MQSNLILTAAQAQAVYSAMCALNPVGGGQVEAYVDEAFALVRETASGSVRVISIRESDKREEYADQGAFAAAYGLGQPVDAQPLLAALQSLEREGWLGHIETEAQKARGSAICEQILEHIRSVRSAIAVATA